MAKLVAQLVLQGARVFGRAFGRALQQEYEASQQAARARSGGRAGGGGGGASNPFSVQGGMPLDEAMKVMNVQELDVDQISSNYEHLFKANSREGSGSLYLQSKVVRAKERLDAELKEKGQTSSRFDDTGQPST